MLRIGLLVGTLLIALPGFSSQEHYQKVGKVITSYHSQFRACYEAELVHHPDYNVQTSLFLSINIMGAVDKAEAMSYSINFPKSLRNCLENVGSLMAGFPKKITYLKIPLHLKAYSYEYGLDDSYGHLNHLANNDLDILTKLLEERVAY